ncbi:MAG: carbohydrate ABC transporter permease [Lachnospiraceae bacterium]|nr:carbohydrate ABC transporter permease [Lachnospiraceae bacterium]
MKSMHKEKRRANIVQNVILILLGIVVVLPIYIAVVNTFKQSDLILNDPLSIPIPPILDNIISVLKNPNANLMQMYGNSIILMVAGTAITIVVASMAAYYLARVSTRFSKSLRIYFLIGIMVPYVIVYLPLCILLRNMNIPFGVPILIFVFVSGNISFASFMYTNYIHSLPIELEEAASIDGASQFQIFWQILFPLIRPCTVTIAIFVGLGIWNDFQTPLLMGQVKTITVGIYTAVGPFSANWGVVFAYVFFAAVPVIVAYLCAQKNFINGLTAGALKG